MNFRVGFGFDVHQLAGPGALARGVESSTPLASAGHTDADVLSHALCDALALGAAGQRGYRSSSPIPMRWKGADSKGLLTAIVVRLIGDAGLECGQRGL
ncbi:MAG: 2-C-methyl-D-erythritol 2,4-cyclodiphosphate synthase [Flavobacteriales bacterium]|nr:2-C-methyl-D-erythritol 2,4-cyclodiphosphate synthase [Flavobacteriales bacterium]